MKDLKRNTDRKNKDWWDELSEENKASIEIGITQLKSGKGISHEEVRGRIDKLLNRKFN